MLGQQNASAAEAPEGGITIVQRGGVPSLIAQGKILDSVTGFSTTLHFPSPELERASALHASGMPIGKPTKDSPFAGLGYFVPRVVARNLKASLQNLTLTVEYPGKNGTVQSMVQTFPLEGYSTRDFSLEAAMGQLPLPLPHCSIRLQYSGEPGSVVAEVSSVEQKQGMVVDSKLENEGNGWAGSGGNPWHLDEETESVLFLTDLGDKPARIGMKVWANGVDYYVTNLKLNPHETRAIDLRQLRDAQRPDFRKDKIPAAATDGSVLWIRLDNVPVMGTLHVTNRPSSIRLFGRPWICSMRPAPSPYCAPTSKGFVAAEATSAGLQAPKRHYGRSPDGR